MEEDIRATLADLKNDLKSDIKDGFKAVHDRIDGMVTKSEFHAVITRIDSEHGRLRVDFDTHVGQTDAIVENVRAQIIVQSDQTRKEMDTELERFRSSSRWAIGIAVSISGVLSAVVFSILQYIGGP